MCVYYCIHMHIYGCVLVCFILKVIFAGVGVGAYMDDVDRSQLLRMSWIYKDVDIYGGLG